MTTRTTTAEITVTLSRDQQGFYKVITPSGSLLTRIAVPNAWGFPTLDMPLQVGADYRHQMYGKVRTVTVEPDSDEFIIALDESGRYRLVSPENLEDL